jgi:L-alanine-DL-glutamate epimerase-like enolase superfamily enzyme
VAEAVDYVHTDATYDGGITGLMKIAHAVEGFGLDVAIHAPGPAHRHCFAALRNCNYYEMGLVHPKLKAIKAPIFKNGYTDELDSVDAKGHVSVPQGPGLGVEIDWEWVRKHETGKVVYE